MPLCVSETVGQGHQASDPRETTPGRHSEQILMIWLVHLMMMSSEDWDRGYVCTNMYKLNSIINFKHSLITCFSGSIILAEFHQYGVRGDFMESPFIIHL